MTSSIWPVLHYDDTRAARAFLVDVVGLHEVEVVSDATGDLVHVELSLGQQGSLIFGSTRHIDSVHGRMRAGSSAVYLVADRAHIDAVRERLRDSTGTILEEPHDAHFGSGAASYTMTLADPEGNLWTLGTFAGAGSRGLY